MLEGSFDERFLAAAGARRRDDDAVAPALLPARREPVRVRGQRRRPGARAAPGTSTCSRAGSRTRRSRSSATSSRGIEGLAGELGAITFVAGRGHVRRQDRAACAGSSSELGGGEASLEAARLAKADQAAELVREFPGSRGPHRRRVRAARRLPGGGLAGDRGAVPPRRGRRRRCRRPRRGRCSRPRTSSTPSTVTFALGNKPTGSRDPFGLRRAAIGLCRLAVEGGLEIPRALARRRGPRLRRGAARGPARRAGRVRARRPGSAAPDLGGVARLARGALRRARDAAFEGVYTAYDRAHRLAGKAPGTRAASSTRRSSRRTRSGRSPRRWPNGLGRRRHPGRRSRRPRRSRR